MNFHLPVFTVLALGIVAAGLASPPAWAGSYYLEVSPADERDLADLFDALEGSLAKDLANMDPVVVILHGEEAASFTLENYTANKALVDRAALLDARRLIDVRMCETWMNENDVRPSDLPAFIEMVPYAPEEIDRLRSEGYLPHPLMQI